MSPETDSSNVADSADFADFTDWDASDTDPGSGARLPRDFFARSVLEVAPDLLGCRLCFGGVTLRITETEAYAGELDPGSHAYRGVTPRTRPMFGPAGVTYTYFTYGNHWMLCLVTGEVGVAEAVLVRAAEVVGGADLVAARRGTASPRDWCRGPGRLAQALALNGEHTGRDFCRPVLGAVEPIELVVREPVGARSAVGSGGSVGRPAIRTGPRVGVSGPGGDGEAYPWRWWIDGDPTVSTYRPGVIRHRRRTPQGRV